MTAVRRIQVQIVMRCKGSGRSHWETLWRKYKCVGVNVDIDICILKKPLTFPGTAMIDLVSTLSRIGLDRTVNNMKGISLKKLTMLGDET